MATYTANRKVVELESSIRQPEVYVNNALINIDYKDGILTLSGVTGGTVVLTTADPVNQLYGIIKITGTLTSALTIQFNVTQTTPGTFDYGFTRKITFWNATSGAFSTTIKTNAGGSTGVVLAQNASQELFHDNTHVWPAAPPTAVAGSTLITSLSAFWRLEESSGTRNDSYSTNHLTDNNTVTQAAGKLGNAAQFTAANSEFLSIADNAALSTGDIDFTIAGWAYFDTLGANRCLVCKADSAGQSEYALEYDNGTGKIIFYVSNNGTALVSVSSTPSMSTGTWYFIVVWHDSVANTINISIDNGTAASASHTTGVFNSTSSFVMGKNVLAAGSYHNGRMDAWGLWKKVLTTSERSELYNSAIGREYPF